MPLIKGKSEKAFGHNVSAEMNASKPQGQALAIAYSIKRKGKKMAKGGVMPSDVEHIERMKTSDEDPNEPIGLAEGGILGSIRSAFGADDEKKEPLSMEEIRSGHKPDHLARGGEMEEMHEVEKYKTSDEEPDELMGSDAHQMYAMGGMHPKHIAMMIMKKNAPKMAEGGEMEPGDFLAPDVEQDLALDEPHEDDELRKHRILSEVMNGLHKKHYGK